MVKWTIRNPSEWNRNQNKNRLFIENGFKNAICEMAAICPEGMSDLNMVIVSRPSCCSCAFPNRSYSTILHVLDVWMIHVKSSIRNNYILYFLRINVLWWISFAYQTNLKWETIISHISYEFVYIVPHYICIEYATYHITCGLTTNYPVHSSHGAVLWNQWSVKSTRVRNKSRLVRLIFTTTEEIGSAGMNTMWKSKTATSP